MTSDNFDIYCEWGERGIDVLVETSDAIIIVDVLSFSTCVAVAVERGAIVYPFFSSTMTAGDYALERDAVLASKQRDTASYSLSPASLLSLPAGSKLVLPSANGSILSTMTGAVPTFAGCLRNARAVATAAMQIGKRISVIPAGERWFKYDFSLRPAFEDWLGAGAVIHFLSGRKSIEAQAAEQTFLHFQHRIYHAFNAIPSGIELIEEGYSQDVFLASESNVSDVAPQLVNGAYQSIAVTH